MFRYRAIQLFRRAFIGVALAAFGLFAAGVSFAEESVDDEIGRFVEKETEILKSLGDKLESDLQVKADKLRNSKGGIDEVRAKLLDDDLSVWSKREELPKSEDAAEAVMRYVQGAEKQKKAIENFRSKLAHKLKSSKKESDASFEPLDKIADALDKTLDSADQLKPKTKFWGTRQNAKSAIQLHLIVKERAGNTFTGVLEQGTNGQFDRMKVAGKTSGTDFYMETTGMINGGNRHLRFTGKLLGGRIECAISGTAANGKPASGAVTLCKKK